MKFIRPDFSDYVVHFSKDEAPITIKDETESDIISITPKSAFDRIKNIIQNKKIYSTRMPWTNKKAICFTECTWSSLLAHSKHYSKYGIGFHKSFVFSRGGGPAIYIAPGLMEHQKTFAQHQAGDPDSKAQPFADTLYAFMTPFCPYYASKDYKEKYWKDSTGKPKKAIDYSHEREWRIPHDLDFDLSSVAFVIVSSYEDVAQFPKELKDAIGRSNFIIMENYEKIERIWPVHHIPDIDHAS
jgi:hypothetical protein